MEEKKLSKQLMHEPWYGFEVDDVIKHLVTDKIAGLKNEEASKRLVTFGPNMLTATQNISWMTLLLNQFKNILILILLFASILSGFLGHVTEAVAIAVIVLFAVILGFVQEFRAERAMEALSKMASPTANVIREGKEMEVPASEVVVGDIVVIVTGDKIPADARLIESINLKVDEASLTGESLSAEKHDRIINGNEIPLGDRKNMVYAGTSATYGRARAVVTGTGNDTEFGKIAGMLQSVESSETPLQKNLDKAGKNLAVAAMIIISIIVAIGLFRGQPFLELFIFGIALAVAVVPEALPAVVTISLAIGVQRMVKRNALVRRLPAVETLGSTTVICTDKTGTLTKDEMTVRKVYLPGNNQTLEISGSGYEPVGNFTLNQQNFNPSKLLLDFLKAGVLCSDATIIENNGSWDVKGDPTEGALVVLGLKSKINKEVLDEETPRVAEIPFSSETKRMTTIHKVVGDKQVAYSKGAVEVILSSCTKFTTENGVENLTDEIRNDILAHAHVFAKEALRVIGISSKPDAVLESAEKEMVFLGFVGMIDPPRLEAKEAIEKCKSAGIRVLMITGDHPITAEAIARELGILHEGKKVLTGVEIDKITDADFAKELEHVDVCARVTPAHKLRIVKALQEQGQIVAMTGDGVNDAPALKKADIGIAMGITGTDVSKEAAAMTLIDDNFASIVAAIEEGRIIFSNIKKYLMYLLSSNIGEIGLMVGSTILGLPLPLSAVQILYVNLATDGLPALALAVDPPENDIMKHQPRKTAANIFSRPVVLLMITGGLWSTLINIFLFIWAKNSGRTTAETMTMVFVSLVMVQFIKAYNFRSDHKSVFHGFFANKWLNRAVLWELLLLLLVIYVPLLHKPFGTYSLPVKDWVIILLLAFSVAPVLELAKWILRKKKYS
jgi:Ca2+-transporting ATPase